MVKSQIPSGGVTLKAPKKRSLLQRLYRDRMFLLMALPGILFLLVFAYLPMGGVLVAFKKMTFNQSNFVLNFLHSQWIGTKNFDFFFKSPDAFRVTRNTVLYNLMFIVSGLVASVFVAISASEIFSKRATKFYQSVMILPAFLSWVIVSYLLYSFLNPTYGFINTTLKSMGLGTVSWYQDQKFWPFIFLFLNLWKNVGLSSIYYFAAISGIDPEMYQSAQIDGATRWKQILHITIPCLRPTMIILTILSLGGIIRSDFGLFWVATLNLGKGSLFNIGSTIDTYIYSALINNGSISLAAASGLYQSIVGFIMIVGANFIVRRIDPEYAIF